MFANLCFQLLDYFNITSNETVKMGIAVFLALLVFALFYFVVKFTDLEISNLNQNILALLTVDIISFAYLMYKRRQDLQEKVNQEKLKEEQSKTQQENQPETQPEQQTQQENQPETQQENQPETQQELQNQVELQEVNEIEENQGESKEEDVPYDIEKKVKEIISEESVSKE